MGVRIKKGSSRLALANLYKMDDVEFWGRPEIPLMEASQDDKVHTVKEGERLDQISLQYFGRDDWDWIIAHRNNLFLLPCAISAGQRLIIPDPSRVRDRIF